MTVGFNAFNLRHNGMYKFFLHILPTLNQPLHDFSQKKILVISMCLGLILLSTNLNAYGQTVPDWIKNNALWWAEGKITEGEYLTGLQYLVDEGILKISSTKSHLKTESSPQDSIRAQSYLVRFSGGEFEKPLEISTFSNFLNAEKPFYIKSFYDLEFTATFSLESNPSIDKREFYEIVSSFYNPGKQTESFDVDIDVLSGNNVPIVTVHYSDCAVTEYFPYLENSVIYYPFSDSLRGEIRDRTVFYCSGIDVIIDKSVKKQELKVTDPPYEERVISYVVHFSGTDFDGLYSVDTFSKFAPSRSLDESPYRIITYSSNHVDSEPQFFLESLPSIDKKQLYGLYAAYVNPGKTPELFDTSIDLILGDGTILQRWNYRECNIFDYRLRLEDSMLSFPFAEKPEPEIRDKTDFVCQGFSLDVGPDLPQTPIRDSIVQESYTGSQIPDENNRAKYFIISIFGGELYEPIVGEKIKSFENIRRDRGSSTPIHHANQYDRGFIIESLPTLEKKSVYEFLFRYVNPGKTPEPFDVNIDTVLGNDSILHRLHYTNCNVVDITWYLQQGTWLYQYTEKRQEEIRERYAVFCEGFRVQFP
ncbi:MAG TPA: hypothetical protein VMW55_10865 [Nitrosopumilaceae archaeon]|nr:hypothetical protein [Nitrosopumilaceae archaeon]